MALQKKKVEAEIKQPKKNKYVSFKMGDVVAKANAILHNKTCTRLTLKLISLPFCMYYQVKSTSGMKRGAMVSKWKEILDSKKTALACD